MQKIHLTAFINAPREKVWETMLGEETYKEWTAAFNPGSYYKGSWEQGSKILFLGPNPDGTSGEGGMVSRIAENRQYEFVSIEHLGVMVNGVEDTTSDFAKAWTPAFENYTFVEKDGGTELVIDVDVTEEMKEEMEAMWHKGLEKLKQMAEGQ
jgi:hypothetical protein